MSDSLSEPLSDVGILQRLLVQRDTEIARQSAELLARDLLIDLDGRIGGFETDGELNVIFPNPKPRGERTTIPYNFPNDWKQLAERVKELALQLHEFVQMEEN